MKYTTLLIAILAYSAPTFAQKKIVDIFGCGEKIKKHLAILKSDVFSSRVESTKSTKYSIKEWGRKWENKKSQTSCENDEFLAQAQQLASLSKYAYKKAIATEDSDFIEIGLYALEELQETCIFTGNSPFLKSLEYLPFFGEKIQSQIANLQILGFFLTAKKGIEKGEFNKSLNSFARQSESLKNATLDVNLYNENLKSLVFERLKEMAQKKIQLGENFVEVLKDFISAIEKLSIVKLDAIEELNTLVFEKIERETNKISQMESWNPEILGLFSRQISPFIAFSGWNEMSEKSLIRYLDVVKKQILKKMDSDLETEFLSFFTTDFAFFLKYLDTNQANELEKFVLSNFLEKSIEKIQALNVGSKFENSLLLQTALFKLLEKYDISINSATNSKNQSFETAFEDLKKHTEFLFLSSENNSLQFKSFCTINKRLGELSMLMYEFGINHNEIYFNDKIIGRISFANSFRQIRTKANTGLQKQIIEKFAHTSELLDNSFYKKAEDSFQTISELCECTSEQSEEVGSYCKAAKDGFIRSREGQGEELLQKAKKQKQRGFCIEAIETVNFARDFLKDHEDADFLQKEIIEACRKQVVFLIEDNSNLNQFQESRILKMVESEVSKKLGSVASFISVAYNQNDIVQNAIQTAKRSDADYAVIVIPDIEQVNQTRNFKRCTAYERFSTNLFLGQHRIFGYKPIDYSEYKIHSSIDAKFHIKILHIASGIFIYSDTFRQPVVIEENVWDSSSPENTYFQPRCTLPESSQAALYSIECPRKISMSNHSSNFKYPDIFKTSIKTISSNSYRIDVSRIISEIIGQE